MKVRPKVEISGITKTHLGIGVGIEVEQEGDGEQEASEVIKAAIEARGKKLSVRRYIMDEEMRVKPADNMKEKEWAQYMRQFARLQETKIGRFMVYTVFLGIKIETEDDDGRNAPMFATVVMRGEDKHAERMAKTIEDAAKNHAVAVEALEAFPRMPWTIAYDYAVNRGWIK